MPLAACSLLKILEEQGISLDQISEGDAHSIPFKGGSFDVVLALAMIYYLSLDRFLGEAYRCLSDNGVLFFCTSNKDVPGFCAAPGTTKYYSIPELYIVLTSHGYSVTFYGAFSCVGGTESLGKRKFLATLKGVLKTMFESTNIGRCIWKGLREAWLGRKIPLPEKITDSNIGSVSHILLDPSKRDQTHRVIYVVAEKK